MDMYPESPEPAREPQTTARHRTLLTGALFGVVAVTASIVAIGAVAGAPAAQSGRASTKPVDRLHT